MLFQPSKAMKVSVLPEQEKQLSSKDRIRMACQQENVLAFDIYSEDLLIGFAMLRQFDKGAFFLWEYAIDHKFQNRHYGTTALLALIRFMRETYNMTEMTTTYKQGNEHAKHIYEKVGFTQTDVIEDYCEVNMVYYC